MSYTLPTKSKRKATLLHSQELKCKNGCGFFGNPEWQGYCSKCHRELNQKARPSCEAKSSSKKIVRRYSDVQDSALALGFTKFEEKKKQQSEKRSKTIKSIIKRGHTSKESVTQSPSKDLYPTELQLGKENLREAVSKDVYNQVQKQLDKMNKSYDKSIDEQSELMQDFYQFMIQRCENHHYYQEMTPDQIEQLMDRLEEILMTCIHRMVFQQISTECEEKDLALQKRIRSLNWITSQLLGTDIKENIPEVRDLIDKAITDIIEMDSKLTPQDKINSIVNCSKNIFEIINLCQGVTASADEFLPAMVYIVLKANPPLLQSNIKYITSYSIPARLRSGEGAYYFTNLCCAVEFIEHLTAESLNLSNEEFEKYLSGEAVPIGYAEQSLAPCEGLRLMYQNLTTLADLHDKQKKLKDEMENFQVEITKFKENVSKNMPSTPRVINPTPYIVPHDVDMSLIPEMLRNRIRRQPLKEDILIDLDCKASHPSADEKNPLLSDFSSVESFAIDDFHNISLENNDNTFIANSELNSSVTNSKSLLTAIGQPVIDIKDVAYPTEIFPDIKSTDSTTSASYQNQTPLECMYELDRSDPVNNPLSSQSVFEEESLNLPPPLQPVVIPSVNQDVSDNI